MSQAPALTAIASATRGSASGRNHARPPVINSSTRRNATTAAASAATSARGRRARAMADVAQIHRNAMADSGYRDQVTSNPEARSMAIRIPAAVRARSEMTSQSHLLTLDSDTSGSLPSPASAGETGQSLAKRRSAQRAPLDAFFDLDRALAAGSHRLPDPRVLPGCAPAPRARGIVAFASLAYNGTPRLCAPRSALAVTDEPSSQASLVMPRCCGRPEAVILT